MGRGHPLSPARRCPSPPASLPSAEGRRAPRTHLGGPGGRAGRAPLGRSEARRGAEPLRLGARGTRLHTEPCNPGQRHNTPRDIRRPAIGRCVEGRVGQPLSGAVTPAARRGAAGAHTPRTHSHKDRRAAPRWAGGAGGGGWRSGAGSGGPPAPRGAAEPCRPQRRPQRRQPLSIGRPGWAARVNYACPGQRRGVTVAAGCGRRARPGPAPAGPRPTLRAAPR